MAKSSKSCGYTGHMRVMDRVNSTKIDYQSGQAKSANAGSAQVVHHSKHKQAYPEVAAEARALAKCNCERKNK